MFGHPERLDGQSCGRTAIPTERGEQPPLGFVPNDTGFNFIVNLKSGLVLDVADNSLKNYATVWQYPFNGGDSQRWQLLK